MKNKIVGIFVCTLLIITCVVPVIGEINSVKNKETGASDSHAYDQMNQNTTEYFEI